MNKIYSIKYSAATGGLIAVSELAKKVICKTNRKISAALLSLAVISYTNIIYAANMDISKAWARDYLMEQKLISEEDLSGTGEQKLISEEDLSGTGEQKLISEEDLSGTGEQKLISEEDLGGSRSGSGTGIAGPEWLLDRPSVNNSQLVVSVAGTVEGTNQDISLKFFEIDLTSRPAHGGKTEQGLSPKSKPFATDSGAMSHKLEKADLLKAIQEQLIANVHSNDDYFEVIDFASDATITDRNGKVYFADKDGSVTLPTQPVQEFLLSGHVRVRPYKEKPIQNQAKSVDVEYTVQFTPLNPDDDFRPGLKDTKLLKTLAIGDTITSQELLAQAQSILNKNHPGYTIYERDSSIVTHDNDIFRTILPMDQEFTYRVKNREQAYRINKKSGLNEEINNTDLISEKYYVLKKGEKPYDPFDRSHLKLFTIKYVDVDTNELLKSEQLLTASERNLDFRDLYDPRDKAKLLYNNLDAFGIMDYTLTGKVEDNHDDTNRIITVYMGKRPEGENASYHLAYDKDRYTEEEREVYSYLRYTGTPIPDNPNDKDKDNSATRYSQFALAMLDGFDTSYQGSIKAAQSSLAMNNALWKVTGNSELKKLNSTGSMVLFNGGKNIFNTLTVDELTTSNSAFVMRTNTQQADQLIVKNKLEGANNLLLVDFIEKKGNDKNGLNIDLVKAPENTSKDVFKTETQTIGFSDVTPEIKQQEKDGKSVWTLTGYKTVANADAAKKATSLMSGGYKAFLAEVGNLNKRMGDLRDINGEAGAWARIMSGTGSAGGGFSDNYTHVQVGADNKHELDGLDLFTGVTMTYTDSHAGSDAFSGETKSVGAGLYASAMFESGAYIGLIGKYVHHDNEYTATFAGLGTRDYSSHSWYAGAEVGYRYHVTDSAWIEPQAELVYGAVSGKQFSWKDQGMNLTMKDKDFNPLIGRTGVDVGKSFSGKDWKVTARAGLGYQFDLFANGETVLRDASGEKRIKGEKDGRMLMNVGLNAEIRDNVRFGLEFEKSAFGKYNVDNAINANFRYSF